MATTVWDAIITRIDDAILARLEGGAVEEYVIRGRQIKYASLEQLQGLRDWAARKKAAGSRGGPFVYAVPGRPGGPP